MLARAARLLLRIAGWLLTPIVVTVGAALGAIIGAMIAPRFSPTGGLVAMGITGLAGASAGMWGWVRLLRGSSRLREALAVTPDGVPQADAVEALMTADPTDHPAS